MSESSEINSIYLDSGLRVSFSPSDLSEKESVLDSEIESDAFEKSSEEGRTETSEGSSESLYGISSATVSYDSSSQVIDYSDRLSHIDNSLNNLYGLFIGALVLVGIGLVLRFIFGLFNK